jgi:hypothetical protein
MRLPFAARYENLAMIGMGLVVLVTAAVVVAVTRSESMDRSAARALAPTNRVEFTLEHVTLAAPRDVGAELRLTADRISVRRRSGARGLLVYHDLREIFAAGVGLVGRIGSTPGTLLSQVVASTKRLLPLESPHGASARSSLDDLRSPRVLFADFSIDLARGDGEGIRLKASSGSLNSGSHILVVDGVTMLMPGNELLRAPRAVFSDALDGVLLPLGYDSAGQHVQPVAFLVLDAAGRLSTAPRVPEVDYVDFIEASEQRVLAHLLERAPPALQPMLALMAGGWGWGVHHP